MEMLKYTGDPWEDVFEEQVRSYLSSLSESCRYPSLTVIVV